MVKRVHGVPREHDAHKWDMEIPLWAVFLSIIGACGLVLAVTLGLISATGGSGL